MPVRVDLRSKSEQTKDGFLNAKRNRIVGKDFSDSSTLKSHGVTTAKGVEHHGEFMVETEHGFYDVEEATGKFYLPTTQEIWGKLTKELQATWTDAEKMSHGINAFSAVDAKRANRFLYAKKCDTFSRLFRAWRFGLDMSGQQVADAIGVTVTCVQRWEQKVQLPSEAMRLRLIERFGEPIEAIYKELEKETNENSV